MVVIDVTNECATAAAAHDAVFLIKITIDRGVIKVGSSSSSRSSIRYCC